MQKKYFKNSIISFMLIVSIISMPLGFVTKKAQAQSIAGYSSGLAVNIDALPQCKKVLSNEMRALFSGVVALADSTISGDDSNTALLKGATATAITYGTSYATDSLRKSLSEQVSEITNSIDSVSVNLEGTKAGRDISDTASRTKKIEESTDSLNKNSTCAQSVGRLVIKMLLQKLTVSTVNWINSGFDGLPAFVQNPGKFFEDIAKNEILQFGLEINNPELFPFGKTWIKKTATAFNNKFQDNARYSLDEFIKSTTPEYSAVTFKQDFSQGGWNAWLAMTQVPANNPLGFDILADNEIQRRLAGTTQSTAEYVHDALAQANGFLGDQRCIDDITITKTQATKTLKETPPRNICPSGFEYVTPGKMISDKATEVLGYQNNAYLNVEDLNDAVAAILDALLNQFSSNLMENGFVNLSTKGADGRLVFTDYGDQSYRSRTEEDFLPIHLSSSWLSANPDFNIRIDLTQSLIDEQRTYVDKLEAQNKELLSTTDGLPYKLDAVDYKLADGTITKISNAYGLLPTIYQLDYCIPGPHPGYEYDSRETLNSVANLIINETSSTVDDGRGGKAIYDAAQSLSPLAGAIIGASIGSVVPVVGTIIGAAIGAAFSAVFGLFGGDDDASKKLRGYYAFQIGAITGFVPDWGSDEVPTTGNISSKQGVMQVLNEILSRYIEIMNKTYFSSPDKLPAVAGEAAINFNQVAGYSQMIKNNTERIISLNTTVNILGDIKESVDELNSRFPEGGVEYENELQAQINAFGRLSANMVNGNDIAGADNLLKQIIDKKEYLYENLLKGPYGCEAALEKPQENFPGATPHLPIPIPNDGKEDVYYKIVQREDRNWNNYNVNSVKRMTYPFPILYDYNTITKEKTIPDPLNSGFLDNKIPSTRNDLLGPGFLSFVYIASGRGKGTEAKDLLGPDFLSFIASGGGKDTENFRGSGRGAERLQIEDLVPFENDGDSSEPLANHFMSLGTNELSAQITNDDGTKTINPTEPFETMIGIY